jgi:hypothetical protein
MKKVLLALPIACLSLFAFAGSSNYGVTGYNNGYDVAAKNSISDEDNQFIVESVRKIYGMPGDGDFTTQMRAGAGRRWFIGKIKFLSNFEEFIWKEVDSQATLTAEEAKVVDVIAKYSTMDTGKDFPIDQIKY